MVAPHGDWQHWSESEGIPLRFGENTMHLQFLTRREAAELLTDTVFPIAPATLAKWASTTTGGPIMRKFGRRVLYERQVLLDWANSKLSAPIRPTSDDNMRTAQPVVPPVTVVGGARNEH